MLPTIPYKCCYITRETLNAILLFFTTAVTKIYIEIHLYLLFTSNLIHIIGHVLL